MKIPDDFAQSEVAAALVAGNEPETRESSNLQKFADMGREELKKYRDELLVKHGKNMERIEKLQDENEKIENHCRQLSDILALVPEAGEQLELGSGEKEAE